MMVSCDSWIENESCAFSFLHWQASISSYTGDHHPYICGIPSHTNEIVIFQIFPLRVHCPLTQCYEIAVRRRPLAFHAWKLQCKLLQKFFLQNFSLTEFIDFYENLTYKNLTAYGCIIYMYTVSPLIMWLSLGRLALHAQEHFVTG